MSNYTFLSLNYSKPKIELFGLRRNEKHPSLAKSKQTSAASGLLSISLRVLVTSLWDVVIAFVLNFVSIQLRTLDALLGGA